MSQFIVECLFDHIIGSNKCIMTFLEALLDLFFGGLLSNIVDF